MSKRKDEQLESILDLNSSNVWDVDAEEIAQLWEKETKEESFLPYEDKLLNVIRLAYEVVHFNPEDEREVAKYPTDVWAIFSRMDPRKGNVAIRRRTISRLNDLSYENVRHITAATLLDLIDRNFGGGWDSIPLSIKDIIESGFEVTTTTLPASRIHAPGGTLEKKVEDGFEVLEVAKGTWIEAIFAKKKAPATKLRFFNENEYDEDGNRIRRHSDDDEEEDYDELDDRDDEEEEEEEMEMEPSENDETFYSSFAPEADVKVDDDDDTAGLSVLE
ncbi:MAG: hypothetical protein IJ699_02500 [Bacteroidaceae bacterium]|nr:hypothetical protein [Bacteroidaceae bacterium]MBR1665086.1 hypothetical protein [Bacteroidaceae bacterium]